MWIENTNPFGSIGAFPRTELTPISVIIGLNGAGKSQLLRGIASGQITTSFDTFGMYTIPNAHRDAVLLTNNDPDPPGLITQVSSDVINVLNSPLRSADAAGLVFAAIKIQKEERDAIDRLMVETIGKTVEDSIGWNDLLEANEYHVPSSLRDQVPDYPKFVNLAQRAGEKIDAFFAKSNGFPSLSMPSRYLGYTRENFAAAAGWFELGLFSQSIVGMFLEYRDRRWRNQVQRQTDIDDGTSLALSTEEFVAAYGLPPWERMNGALHAFGLPYQISPVSSQLNIPVGFSLIRDGSQAKINYAELSSGETVLLKMMLASFQADDERLNVRSPKVVLLDELDASLHPENVNRWLAAIQDGYVEKLGINCILTTHSPTTVALSPGDSIYEMTAETPYPVKIDKQKALDRLTAGLPTLSINYSARRQVFTESTIDVEHYSMLHDVMRARLDMQRTLSFVGTSTMGSCVFVFDMVEHMEKNGNTSVFGIVDWDLKNKGTGRVKVIADGTHYSKDNVILDPLLIGALMLKDDQLKLYPPIRYSELRGASSDLLQRISDFIVSRIKFPHAASSDIAENHYYGGMVLPVREEYLRRNGHELEQAIKAAFPMLDGRYKSEGELASAIIRRVIADYPEYCPLPVSDLLTSLANDAP